MVPDGLMGSCHQGVFNHRTVAQSVIFSFYVKSGNCCVENFRRSADTQTSSSNSTSHVKLTEITFFPTFWCLMWILLEAIDQYLFDFMHWAAATWFADLITAEMKWADVQVLLLKWTMGICSVEKDNSFQEDLQYSFRTFTPLFPGSQQIWDGIKVFEEKLLMKHHSCSTVSTTKVTKLHLAEFSRHSLNSLVVCNYVMM